MNDLREHNAANIARRAAALQWRDSLATPHALAWVEQEQVFRYSGVQVFGGAGVSALEAQAISRRLKAEGRTSQMENAIARLALEALFGAEQFPAEVGAQEVAWQRDALGKPYLTWEGAVADWASDWGRSASHLHVSNTHDGGAQIVLAMYSEHLVGLGLDAVHLPRLRRNGKDANYLRRLARLFMSAEEWERFEASAAWEDEDALRLQVAAHFSLMESASKACGTGLKLGIGMSKPLSLPMSALGVRQLEPTVELLLGPEAQARMETLGARRAEAYWSEDGEFLISVVLLWA